MAIHGFPRLEQAGTPQGRGRRRGRGVLGRRKEAEFAAVARLPVVEVQQNGHTSWISQIAMLFVKATDGD